PSDLDAGDEGYLGFSSKYTKTTINNLIVNGDGATNAVTAITVKSAGDVTTVNNSATLQMSVEVTPSSAKNKEVTWAITAGDAATIDPESGLLTADTTKTGEVTVEATAKDGSGVKGTKQITVTGG
ncbi:Ig-like domain-containing protein, partial [Salmonella enterica]